MFLLCSLSAATERGQAEAVRAGREKAYRLKEEKVVEL